MEVTRGAKFSRRERLENWPPGATTDELPRCRAQPRLEVESAAGHVQDGRERLLDDLFGSRLVPDQGHRVSEDSVLVLLHRRFERRSSLGFQAGLPSTIYQHNANGVSKLQRLAQPSPSGEPARATPGERGHGGEVQYSTRQGWRTF